MGIHIVGVDLSVTATGLADSTGRTGRVGRPGITVMELPERLAALRQLGGRIHQWIQDGIPPGAPGPILLCIEGRRNLIQLFSCLLSPSHSILLHYRTL